MDDHADTSKWIKPCRNPEDVRNEFDRIGKNYDDDLLKKGYRGPENTARMLADIIPFETGILDAGCGTGLVGLYLHHQGFQNITGLDFSAECLKEAGQKNAYTNLINSNLIERLPYGIESKRPTLRNIIKLNENENPFGPGQMAMAALREEITRVSRYPDLDGDPLKQALAEHHHLTTDQITLSNGSGSVSLLLLLAELFATRNDKIIFSDQGFISFLFRFRTIGMPGRQYTIISRDKHRHDLTAMANAVTADTKLLFIENPDNPTGTWISHDELAAFLTGIPEHVIVVIDEAYYEYARYALGKDYPDTLRLQKKHANLITIRTFSKAYGLAGLRVAYAVSSPELSEIMNKKWLKRSVTSPALVAACAALKDEDHLKLTLENNEIGMRYLENSFSKINISYIPSAANFITFDAGKNAQEIFKKLKQRNILINPLKGYNLPSNLRVTIGLAEENRAFIENLRDIWQEAKSVNSLDYKN